MNRASFLRSLFLVAASPKVLTELKAPVNVAPLSAGLFNDLRFVIPEPVHALVAKYGSADFFLAMETLGQRGDEADIRFFQIEKIGEQSTPK